MKKRKHAKSEAREIAMRYMYSENINDKFSIEEIKIKDKLAKRIILEIIENKEEIDQYIKKYLKKWNFSEINPVNTAILEVSIWEMIYDKTDTRIIISEALMLASEYSDANARNFIHYVLDKIDKELKKQ